MDRVASIRVADPEVDESHLPRLTEALLTGSPRVAQAGRDLFRVDARGWGRLGGEVALARTLHAAIGDAGFSSVRIGIADVAVASDAAAGLAHEATPPGTLIVPPGRTREFLAPLPLVFLPVPDDLKDTLRALGLRRLGQIAIRERAELEARFGPEGVRAHRLAGGQDDRVFQPIVAGEPPEASLELQGRVDQLEQLLFALRHLLHRVCEDLASDGRCASRILLLFRLESGRRRRATVVPARPTRREELLFDLCRAVLERATGETGRLSAPVVEFTIRAEQTAAAESRQGDLFAGEWRDPLAAAAVLSRLRARLGPEGVITPVERANHRPESRNAWQRATDLPDPSREGVDSLSQGEPASALRLLRDPIAVEVEMAEGQLTEYQGPLGRQSLIAAEGPERLSGDWWKDPYRREYYRACTSEGELLWLFREYRPSGTLRWWLHGWWD
jgi:protein ImuB